MSQKKTTFFWEKFPTSKNLENMRTLTDIKKEHGWILSLKIGENLLMSEIVPRTF